MEPIVAASLSGVEEEDRSPEGEPFRLAGLPRPDSYATLALPTCCSGLLLCIMLALTAPAKLRADPGLRLDSAAGAIDHSLMSRIGSYLGLELGSRPAGCYRVELLEIPESPLKELSPAVLSWTSSGVWYGNSLFLADMSRGPLARLRVDKRGGEPVTSVSKLANAPERLRQTGKAQEELGVIFFAYPRDDGYLLGKYDTQQVDGHNLLTSKILFVNSEGEIEETLQPRSRIGIDSSRGIQVVSGGVSQMIPMNEGVFMVGGVKPRGDDDDYWTAFAYIDRKEYEPFHIQLRGAESMQALGNKYYSRDFLLMARIRDADVGDVAYVLVMEGEPWIGRVSQDETEIIRWVDLSDEYRIPAFQNREKFNGQQSEAVRFYRDLFRFVEGQNMPIGLFSFENRLFLLVKGAKSRTGKTSWHVREVLIEEGRLVDEVINLPVTSAHVAIVPPATSSDDDFFIVEKGPVSINRGGDLPDLLHRSVRFGTLVESSWFDLGATDKDRRSGCSNVPVSFP